MSSSKAQREFEIEHLRRAGHACAGQPLEVIASIIRCALDDVILGPIAFGSPEFGVIARRSQEAAEATS